MDTTMETPDEIRWRKIRNMSKDEMSSVLCYAHGAASNRKKWGDSTDFFEVIDFGIKILEEKQAR